MKKLLAISLAIILTLSLTAILATACPACEAAAEVNTDEIRVILDGEQLEFDVPPQIIDNRTMVPMRAIFEAFGMEVEWDGNEQSVIATSGAGHFILLVIDSPVMVVSTPIAYLTDIAAPTDVPEGAEPVGFVRTVLLDVPPQIVDNRTLVPVRAISEGLNAEVDWCEDTRTVMIATIANESPVEPHEPLEIDEIQLEARYYFEQRLLPHIMFGSGSDIIVEIIVDELAELAEFNIRLNWIMAAATFALPDLSEILAANEPTSVEAMEEVLAILDARLLEEGFNAAAHIIDVTIEQIDDGINAIVVELYAIEEPLFSSFIAIVYGEDVGMRYFTLERSFGALPSGEIPYVLCFIAPGERGSFFVIENNKETFITAIAMVIYGNVQPLSTQPWQF